MDIILQTIKKFVRTARSRISETNEEVIEIMKESNYATRAARYNTIVAELKGFLKAHIKEFEGLLNFDRKI